MNDELKKLLIHKNLTIKEALKQMDIAGEKALFVVDEKNILLGSVTDGDIRRWILKEGSLNESITKIYRQKPMTLPANHSVKDVKGLMIQNKIEAVPVVDEKNQLINIHLWSQIFSNGKRPIKAELGLPVLIMAGGKGTRLDPFTKILPKPLIPIGDKPIIEIIMDQFYDYGCKNFFLTVNYKGKMIQSYFDNSECQYHIKFVWEEKFLGTAGSIKLAMPEIDAPHFFVSNCDIIIKADYEDIVNFHRDNDFDVTLIGSMQHISVPYGVLEIQNGGDLKTIVEKPEFDFLANTGLYLVKSNVTQFIPEGEVFDFPHLLEVLKKQNKKIGIYPVSQESWIDIGQWSEYQSALKKIGTL